MRIRQKKKVGRLLFCVRLFFLFCLGENKLFWLVVILVVSVFSCCSVCHPFLVAGLLVLSVTKSLMLCLSFVFFGRRINRLNC